MNTEHVPIDSVRVDPANVRKHSKRNLDTIKRSLEAFGQQKPIVVGADGVVVAGNGTLDAARALGWSHIDVVRTALEGSARKAYAVADNQTAALAEWSEPDLGALLASLKADETFDETVTGFDEREIERLIGADEVVEDETPPVPETAITRPGDLWLLGDHRVLCGDATKAEDVGRCMGSEKAGLCFTSPPYAQQRDYGKKIEDWDGLMRGVFGNLPMTDDGQVLVNLGMIHRDGEWWPYWDGWIEWMRSQGWLRFGWYVWDKGEAARTSGTRLPTAHEFVFHWCKGHSALIKVDPCKSAGASKWLPARFSTKAGQHREADRFVTVGDYKVRGSVCHISKGDVPGLDHPAAYPVRFVLYWVESWHGDIYDPFLGSGTTLIAAEQLGRKCYGIEIEPRYVDVTLKRWANLTGKQPTRESDGKTFAEIEGGSTPTPAIA